MGLRTVLHQDLKIVTRRSIIVELGNYVNIPEESLAIMQKDLLQMLVWLFKPVSGADRFAQV